MAHCIRWEGKGLDEIAKDRNTGMTLVEVKADLFRPNDIPMLRGSARKAKRELGWSANIGFKVCNCFADSKDVY
jgi:GDPmannose 4,6-dehydratase